MRVFRVHRSDDVKIGPFVGGAGIYKLTGKPNPEPVYDGIHEFYWGIHFCGCKSLLSLFDWFGESWRQLYETNFIVSVLDVPDNDVKVGNHQVAFVFGREKVVQVLQTFKDLINAYRNEVIGV